MENKMANKARCEICKVIIESKYRHDFVNCPGGHIFVDGGSEYFRCGYDVPENFTRIYENGTEENMVESIRKHNEEHWVQTEEERLAIALAELPEKSFEERTNILLDDILKELKEIKRLIHAK